MIKTIESSSNSEEEESNVINNENDKQMPSVRFNEEKDETENEKLDEEPDEKLDSLVDEVTITQQQDNSGNENKEKENVTESTEPIKDEQEFHIETKESIFEEVEPDDNVRDSLEE